METCTKSILHIQNVLGPDRVRHDVLGHPTNLDGRFLYKQFIFFGIQDRSQFVLLYVYWLIRYGLF